MAYKLNENYFDEIDTPNKAYWLGFIWGDGYVCKRERSENYTEYAFKLSLASVDASHLELFRKEICAENDIKTYVPTGGFGSTNLEARFSVYQKHLPYILYHKYGIVPNRKSLLDIKNNLARIFYSDFIRGVVDADGTITGKKIFYKKERFEFSLGVIGNDDFLNLYNDFLNEENITQTKYKRSVRHEGRDGGKSSIRTTGNEKVEKIIKLLGYNNSLKTSLERKRLSAMAVLEYMEEYRDEKNKII